jgi:hypothetical protein
MADGKSPELVELEHSLINFLCQKREVEEKVSGGVRRVRGLSMGLDFKDEKRPMFTVQIGVCEAGFSAVTGLKEKGNCFGLERFIRDWFERPTVKHTFKTMIDASKK